MDGDGRIVPLLLTADDGAREVSAGWDQEHHEAVMPEPDNQGQLRWFGRTPVVAGGYHADAECAEPVALSETCSNTLLPPTTGFLREVAAQCAAAGSPRYLLGNEVSAESGLFVDTTNGCLVTNPSIEGNRSYLLADPLSDDDFAPVTVQVVGGSRLTHEVFGTPDGQALIPSRVIRDPMLEGETCVFRNLGDGDLLCLPPGPNVTNSYLDASCTQRIAYFAAIDECDDGFKYAVGSAQVFELGGRSAWGYWMLDGETCVADSVGPPDGTLVLQVWEVGAELPVTLVHAEDVVE